MKDNTNQNMGIMFSYTLLPLDQLNSAALNSFS